MSVFPLRLIVYLLGFSFAVLYLLRLFRKELPIWSRPFIRRLYEFLLGSLWGSFFFQFIAPLFGVEEHDLRSPKALYLRLTLMLLTGLTYLLILIRADREDQELWDRLQLMDRMREEENGDHLSQRRESERDD